jgi:protein NrfC
MKTDIPYERENETPDVSRRGFLQIAGAVAVGISLGSCTKSGNESSRTLNISDLSPDAIPSEGYLLVDTKKCQGCISCMMACTLAHEGEINPSLSRIQVMQNPFGHFPDDIVLAQCRQCVEPACVDACPEDALFIDKERGNVRRVDTGKCIGCKSCVQACPFEPSRSVWNSDGQYAQKCDLCNETPYWEDKGETDVKQACVAICPVGAITFSMAIPLQEGDDGYNVNLRGKLWASLGYPTD